MANRSERWSRTNDFTELPFVVTYNNTRGGWIVAVIGVLAIVAPHWAAEPVGAGRMLAYSAGGLLALLIGLSWIRGGRQHAVTEENITLTGRGLLGSRVEVTPTAEFTQVIVVRSMTHNDRSSGVWLRHRSRPGANVWLAQASRAACDRLAANVGSLLSLPVIESTNMSATYLDRPEEIALEQDPQPADALMKHHAESLLALGYTSVGAYAVPRNFVRVLALRHNELDVHAALVTDGWSPMRLEILAPRRAATTGIVTTEDDIQAIHELALDRLNDAGNYRGHATELTREPAAAFPDLFAKAWREHVEAQAA